SASTTASWPGGWRRSSRPTGRCASSSTPRSGRSAGWCTAQKTAPFTCSRKCSNLAAGINRIPGSRFPPRRCPVQVLSTLLGGHHAVHAQTDPLPSLDAQRPVAAADRESLREQLWRRAQEAERDHRAARVARLREHAEPRAERPEARG